MAGDETPAEAEMKDSEQNLGPKPEELEIYVSETNLVHPKPEELVAKAIVPVKMQYLRPPPPRPTVNGERDGDRRISSSNVVKEKKSRRQLKRERQQMDEEQENSLRSDGNARRRQRANYTTWNDEEDRVMLHLLEAQVSKGNRLADGTWHRETWDEVLPAFNEQLKTNKTEAHVKARMKTWKKIYQIVRHMLEQRGASWDPINKKVTGGNDFMWVDYFEDHPEARKYYTCGCPLYDQLCSVVGSSIASGDHIQSAVPVTVVTPAYLDDIGMDSSAHNLDYEVPLRRNVGSSTEEGSDPEIATGHTRCRPTTPLTSHQRDTNRPHSQTETIERMVVAIESMAEAFVRMVDREYYVDGWYEALLEIPNLDPELKFDAAYLLRHRDDKLAFIKMDPVERLSWLSWKRKQPRN